MCDQNQVFKDQMIIKECNKIVQVINEAKSLNTMSDDYEKTEASVTKFGKRGKAYTLGLDQFKEK